MNPLGSLPASNSPQFRLNALDWVKILRLAATQTVGAFVALAPTFAGYRYVFHGTDYTPIVLLAGSALVDAGRRFVDGQKAAQ